MKNKYTSNDSRQDHEWHDYDIKKEVLNSSEIALFRELNKQLPKDYYIFPNMRVADILMTHNGKGYYERRNAMLPRHIDFLICDAHFRPVIAIELNGGSHSNPKRAASDEVKRNVFDGAGLPLHVIYVGDDFSEQIKKVLDGLIRK